LFRLPLPRGSEVEIAERRVEQDETESFGNGPNTS
jgi:hypothetical protein